MIVEGVRYYRFIVRFRWADGRRARWVRWAPAVVFMREQLIRELDAKDIESEMLRPRSCTIRLAE